MSLPFNCIVALGVICCIWLRLKIKKRNSGNETSQCTPSPTLRISTCYFNNFLSSLGRKYQRGFRIWFTVGALCCLISFLPTMYLFVTSFATNINSLIHKFHGSTDGVSNIASLEAVLPGVNLPGSDIFYYISAIFVSSVVHEFGHAVAATSEHLTVHGTGFLLIIVFPAAFVDLPSSDLGLLPIFSQIRIYAAGVWHNVVLGLVSWLALVSLPLLLSPFYQQDMGVMVLDIAKDSPVGGENGLKFMQIIQFVDDCPVLSEESWRHCFQEALKKQSPGFCVEKDLVDSVPLRDLDAASLVGCCPDDIDSSLCFRSSHHKFCLPARAVVRHSTVCRKGKCLGNSTCLVPITGIENSTLPRLIVLKTLSEKEVLFLGHPGDIYRTVLVSSFLASHWILISVPAMCKKFLAYLCSISAGLACVNVIPCMGLDGFYLSKVCTYSLLRQRCHPRVIQNLQTCISSFGTTLVVLTVLLSFVQLLT